MGHRRHESWDMSNLGIGRAFATVVGASALAGAAVGLGVARLGSWLFVHLRTNGLSSHPTELHHAPRSFRG